MLSAADPYLLCAHLDVVPTGERERSSYHIIALHGIVAPNHVTPSLKNHENPLTFSPRVSPIKDPQDSEGTLTKTPRVISKTPNREFSWAQTLNCSPNPPPITLIACPFTYLGDVETKLLCPLSIHQVVRGSVPWGHNPSGWAGLHLWSWRH